MLNRKEYLDKVNSYFKKNKKVLELFNKQIELFYSYETDLYHEYDVDSDVILNKNTLIHGSRCSIDEIKLIADSGIISSEFYKEYNKYKKKPFVVELWDIYEEITLKNYLDKYTGVTIDFKNNSGEIIKREITPFDKIMDVIRSTSGFRDYIIYQNMEQRTLPNDVIVNNSNLAFIVEYEDNCELIKNDIFNENFDKYILKKIVPKWFYEKYLSTRNFDNYEPGREKAILFGIPSSMIKGILVSRKLEEDKESLEKIKQIFPKCYICNLDGKVIIK